jgi:hypothetical protein
MYPRKLTVIWMCLLVPLSVPLSDMDTAHRAQRETDSHAARGLGALG